MYCFQSSMANNPILYNFCLKQKLPFSFRIWYRSSTYCGNISGTYGGVMLLELFSLVTAARFDRFGRFLLYYWIKWRDRDPKDRLPLLGGNSIDSETDLEGVYEAQSPTPTVSAVILALFLKRHSLLPCIIISEDVLSPNFLFHPQGALRGRSLPSVSF